VMEVVERIGIEPTTSALITAHDAAIVH
jgi:hypothetical protein